MGCGESKHVATGNTISRKNSRAGSKREKTSETVEETSKNDSNTSSLVKEEGKNFNQDSGAENSRAVADGKGITESKELKKEQNVELDKEKKTGIVKENEEPVEGIAFEGISGRYEAPNQSLSKEDVKPAEALEDKKLSEETKEQTVEEIKLAEETKEETRGDTLENKKPTEDAKEETVQDQKLAEKKKEETANGKPETVKEENLVEGTETAETTEAKDSTAEETPTDSSAEDLKAG